MEHEHPLVFGDAPAELDGAETPARRPPPKGLEAVARKVLATLEPLDPPDRARVLRAAAILLGLDDYSPSPWIR
jgi:hypothetical protein